MCSRCVQSRQNIFEYYILQVAFHYSNFDENGIVANRCSTRNGGSTVADVNPIHRFALSITNDMTGQSTGTGEYGDFVKVFKDRYEKLSTAAPVFNDLLREWR